jgi:hypothetical protein
MVPKKVTTRKRSSWYVGSSLLLLYFGSRPCSVFSLLRFSRLGKCVCGTQVGEGLDYSGEGWPSNSFSPRASGAGGNSFSDRRGCSVHRRVVSVPHVPTSLAVLEAPAAPTHDASLIVVPSPTTVSI